MIGIPVLE